MLFSFRNIIMYNSVGFMNVENRWESFSQLSIGNIACYTTHTHRHMHTQHFITELIISDSRTHGDFNCTNSETFRILFVCLSSSFLGIFVNGGGCQIKPLGTI